mgnify:CR=1 FL=1
MGTGVDVDKLDGFRPPVGDERERYCNECIKRLNSESIPIIIWLIIISPVCVLMWLSLIGYISGETFVIDGEFMVFLLVVLCMSVVEYFLVSYINSGRIKKKSLRVGNFWVLDCKAYDGNVVTDTTGGEVFIETLGGQKCRQSFPVGTDLAIECCKYLEKGTDDYIPLVLISCCFDYWILRR